jgi:IS1 family transposase
MLVDWFWSSLLLSILLLWLLWHWLQLWPHPQTTTVTTARERLLKPRTPADCLTCRQEGATAPNHPSARIPVTPWRERKSRRGAPKRILTQGFACPNRTCLYYQITDTHIHALVGDGAYGHTNESRPCAAKPVAPPSAHAAGTLWVTPLYRLKTASHRVAEVLTALAEGLSVAAAVRIFGHHHATITIWLTRAGMHSVTLHDRCFHNLTLPHLQLDELRTRLRSRVPALWLWVAVDPLTKIIPVLHLGARTQDAAHAVVHELHGRLASACLPVFTSDGLNYYFYALTAHFGQWAASVGQRARRWQVAAGLIYGQVKKRYRRRRLVEVTYMLRCGTREALQSALRELGLSGKLNTAFVERVNLTLRQSVAALIRRTWSTMQDAPQLLLHLEW